MPYTKTFDNLRKAEIVVKRVKAAQQNTNVAEKTIDNKRIVVNYEQKKKIILKNLTRYDFSGRYDCDGDEIPVYREDSPTGVYIKFSDHEEALRFALNNTGIPKLINKMEDFAKECKNAGNAKDARQVRSWVKQLKRCLK